MELSSVPRSPSAFSSFSRSWDARGKAADAGGTVTCLTCGVRASGAPVRARPATLRGAQRASVFNDTQIMAKMRSVAKSEPYKNTFAGRSLPTVGRQMCLLNLSFPGDSRSSFYHFSHVVKNLLRFLRK